MEKLTLVELQNMCHQRSSDAGWWDDYTSMPEAYRKYFLASRYALIHSEGSEAFEGLRKGGQDSHLPHRCAEEVELADMVIRILDYSGHKKFDLIGAIMEKLDYNMHRQDHTLEARKSNGGKSL